MAQHGLRNGCITIVKMKGQDSVNYDEMNTFSCEE